MAHEASSYVKIRNPFKLTFSVTTRRKSVSFEGLRMSQERMVARGPELVRWILVAAVLVVGLVLFFIYAPLSDPPAPPAAHEAP
jgi:hypothetical protein